MKYVRIVGLSRIHALNGAGVKVPSHLRRQIKLRSLLHQDVDVTGAWQFLLI